MNPPTIKAAIAAEIKALIMKGRDPLKFLKKQGQVTIASRSMLTPRQVEDMINIARKYEGLAAKEILGYFSDPLNTSRLGFVAFIESRGHIVSFGWEYLYSKFHIPGEEQSFRGLGVRRLDLMYTHPKYQCRGFAEEIVRARLNIWPVIEAIIGQLKREEILILNRKGVERDLYGKEITVSALLDAIRQGFVISHIQNSGHMVNFMEIADGLGFKETQDSKALVVPCQFNATYSEKEHLITLSLANPTSIGGMSVRTYDLTTLQGSEDKAAEIAEIWANLTKPYAKMIQPIGEGKVQLVLEYGLGIDRVAKLEQLIVELGAYRPATVDEFKIFNVMKSSDYSGFYCPLDNPIRRVAYQKVQVVTEN